MGAAADRGNRKPFVKVNSAGGRLRLSRNIVYTLIHADRVGRTERQAVLDKRGMDFADIDEAFFGRALISTGKLGRLVAVGVIDDMTVAVVFARRGTEGVSVVTMRPATRKERNRIG